MNFFKKEEPEEPEEPDERIDHFKPKDYNFENYKIPVNTKDLIYHVEDVFKTNHYYKIEGSKGSLPDPMIAKYLNKLDKDTILDNTIIDKKGDFNFFYVFKNENGDLIDKYGRINEKGFPLNPNGSPNKNSNGDNTDVYGNIIDENGFCIDEKGKHITDEKGNPITHIKPPIESLKFTISSIRGNGGLTIFRHNSAFKNLEMFTKNYILNGGKTNKYKKSKKNRKNKKNKKSKKTRKNKK